MKCIVCVHTLMCMAEHLTHVRGVEIWIVSICKCMVLHCRHLDMLDHASCGKEGFFLLCGSQLSGWGLPVHVNN